MLRGCPGLSAAVTSGTTAPAAKLKAEATAACDKRELAAGAAWLNSCR